MSGQFSTLIISTANRIHYYARLIDLQSTTKLDTKPQCLRYFIEHGWPTNVANVPEILCDFWKIRDSLCIANDLILFGNRLP